MAIYIIYVSVISVLNYIAGVKVVKFEGNKITFIKKHWYEYKCQVFNIVKANIALVCTTYHIILAPH